MKFIGTPLFGSDDTFLSGIQSEPGSLVHLPVAPEDSFNGTSGNDTITGTAGDDVIDASQGGNDTINALAGDDIVTMGNTLNAGDKINGGDGFDTVSINGNYGGLVLGAQTIVNVENLQMAAGHNYNITTNQATIASGASMNFDASALGAANTFTLNGSAETDGGSINVTGGAGNDVITTGTGGDFIDASHGGNDTINLGGDSNDPMGFGDGVYFGAAFTAADQVNGGDPANPGNVAISLQGNYSGGVTLGATTMTNVGILALESGAPLSQSFSYVITTNDANVAAGQNLVVAAGHLHSTETLNFNGAAETDGSFNITGGAGNDMLVGGAGDDFFKGDAGDDFIDGGAGKNRATYSDDGAGVTVSLLQQGHAQNTGDGNDTLNNIQDVSAGAGNDVLTGDNNANWLWGEGGSDNIQGGGGNDLIQVGTLGGELGTDTVDGGAGTNTISFDDNGGQYSSVTFSLALQGSAQATGVDTVTATNFQNVVGSSLDDVLTGNTAANSLYGGSGADQLNGGVGNDFLYGDQTYVGSTSLSGGDGPTGALVVDPGTGGDDVLDGGAGNDTLDGGEGNDTAVYSDATGGVAVSLLISGAQAVGGGLGTDTLTSIENLTGGIGNDKLTGDTNDNVLTGNAGNDQFFTGGGADTVNGGDGNDTVFYNAPGVLTFNGGAGTDTLDAHLVSFDTNFVLGDDVENYVGGTGQDTVTVMTPASTVARSIQGGDGNDTISAGAGNDKLDGGNGDDVISISEGGNDTVTGDAGDDVINAFAGPSSTPSLTAADKVDGGVGNDVLQISGDFSAGFTFGATTMVNVENLVLTAGFSYKLVTNDANVAAGATLTVDGSDLGATDVLNFNGSHETDGAFFIFGGAGNDVLVGGAGADTFDLSTGGNDNAQGGAGNDAFDFGAAFTPQDVVNGGAGSDTVVLNGDYSTLQTIGNFSLVGVETLRLTAEHSYNLAANTATVANGTTLTVDGSTLGFTDTLTFNASHSTTTATFAITGGAGNDVLTGSANNDTLSGGAGNNTMKGGAGADHIVCGAGVDTLVVATPSDSTGTQNGGSAGTGYDSVSFFDMASDKFDLGTTVTGISTHVSGATISTVTFDTDMGNTLGAAQLAANHAVLVSVTGGTLAGDTFLVVDGNGQAGYQPAGDYVFLVDHVGHIGSLSAAVFI